MTSPSQVPSTIHIDNRGEVTDPQTKERLDLSQPQFSEIQSAMSSQGGSDKSWTPGDYRLENGRLVSTK